MKLALIILFVVIVISMCVQAVGLILVLAVMKKQGQTLDILERREAALPADPETMPPAEANDNPEREGEIG